MKNSFFSLIILFTFLLSNSVIWGSNLMAQNDYQVSGKINIDSLTLANFSNEFGANSINTELKLEVWKVTYRGVKVNEQNEIRVYFNEKIASPIIERNSNLVDNGIEISYTIRNIPTEEEYVLLYYFNKMPAAINYSKLESKLYQDVNSKLLRHATNVRHKLTPDVKYGAIYLNPNNLKEQELSVYSLEEIPLATFSFIGDVWDDIGDFFSDAADFVFDGGKRIAGVIVSAGGTILVQGYGISKELVVNGRIPRYRKVTKREYDFANKYLFGGTLPSRSKILVSNLLGVGDREFVWPTGTGHFLMNMGKAGYKDALYKEGLFIHEMTHVWQLHVTDDIKWTIKGITSQIKNSATDENVYSVNCNDNWGSMNLEQQATVAENCFLERKKGAFGGACENKVVKHIRNGNRFYSSNPLPSPNHTKKPVIIGKTYYIQSKVSGLHLDVKGASKASKIPIWQYTRNNSIAQKWRFIPAGKGYYYIQSKASGLYLDVKGGSKKSRTIVWQYTRNNSIAQKWKLIDAGKGYYYIQSKVSGLYLDVQGGSKKSKTPVWQYKRNGSDAQKWRFVAAQT